MKSETPQQRVSVDKRCFEASLHVHCYPVMQHAVAGAPGLSCGSHRRGSLRFRALAGRPRSGPRSGRLHAFAPLVVPDESSLDAYLDTLKWDEKGLLVAIAQACALKSRRCVCWAGT